MNLGHFRREGFGKIGRDVGPCPLLAGRISLGEKLLESGDHRGARNTEPTASSRVDGSFVAGRSVPARIADRSCR